MSSTPILVQRNTHPNNPSGIDNGRASACKSQNRAIVSTRMLILGTAYAYLVARVDYHLSPLELPVV